MGPALAVAVLSLLLGSQAVSTDMYLPALPGLTADLGATMSQAQLTLSGMLLAFGISQLAWGPLSDRFGRRPILLWGLGLFTLASAGCALAPSMDSLIVWRVVQGAAMGAAITVARAMVRDLFEPHEGVRAMSRAMTGLGVMACLCAPVGSVIMEFAGWRWVLASVALFGAGTLALIVNGFPETLPAQRRASLDPRALARTWLTILRHPGFRTCAALSTATYGGLFTFLATSSFIFMQVLGLSRLQYGLTMLSMSGMYIAGTFLCRHLLVRLGLRRTVAVGGALALAGGTGMGVLALAGWHSFWAIMPPFMLFMLSHGISQPCGQTGAVAPFPQSAGAASALNGFTMMVVAFVMGSWLGTRLDGTVFALTHGLWFWGAVVALIAWTGFQRHGDPRRA